MRGYFGIGIYRAKTAENVGGLWRSAHAFGASFIFTVGARYYRDRLDVSAAPKSVPLFEYETIEEMVANRPMHGRIVGIEYPGKRTLQSYHHPEQAIYLLGAEDHGLPDKVLDLCDSVVEIGGCSICLNVATTGGVVLYDRLVKAG